MTEAKSEPKSVAGLIDHVLRKHELYSQAECADIPHTIGADLIAVVLSYAAEREQKGYAEGWEIAHSSAPCGHARANQRDPKYGTSEYRGEESCEFCAYAAERERLLAEADAVINWATDAFPITWVADSGVGRALERHRLRSRPATEGKREDD